MTQALMVQVQTRPGSSRLSRKEPPHKELSTEKESPEPGAEINTDEEQPDAPRVAQWVDDEELELEDDESSSAEEQGSGIITLKRDLSKLPLGALVKAQRVVRAAERDSDDEESETSDSGSEQPETTRVGKDGAGNSITKPKERRQIEHRSNKHAPMEITSKKPVTRRRQVVEVHQVKPRDPRFSDLSGTLSVDQFRSNYDFLPSLHTSELSTLKDSLARARKLLVSSPRDLRPEREAEVQRLEQALKRAESTVNRERREEAERRAFGKLQQEEKEKRKTGKKAWFMKDADKKAVRVRARLDAIAASGGKRAVKKAIEKKQRKIGQKEKKSRPFAPKGRATGSQKRPREEGGGSERQHKRPRVQ